MNAQVFAASIRIACLLALVSLGFNLMYGVIRFLNLAHGEVMVLGALIIERLTRIMQITYAFLAGILIVVVVGLIVGRLLFQPLRLQPRGAMLATSLGMAVLLQVMISSYNKQASIAIRPVGATLTSFAWNSSAALILSALLATIFIELWLRLTKFGRAIVVTAENPDLAEAWGLPIKAIQDSVFALSFGLAALAGGLLALHYSVSFGFAFKMEVWAFSAVLLGGLGKPFAGVVASFAVAALWSFLGRIGVEPFGDAVLLAVCALYYAMFPSGILGPRMGLT